MTSETGPPGGDRLRGKVVVVTGATSGLGRETARVLAADGARVGVVGRNPTATAQTVAEITAAGGDAVALLCDLSSQRQIRKLAGEILNRWDRLDILVNNAGAVNSQREITEDGHELTFAVNHLAPFLLTRLLLDRLQSSAPSRIVNVASNAHFGTKLAFDDLHNERDYRAYSVYKQSKLANVLFTYALNRRIPDGGLTVNALHPGGVRTGFGMRTGGLLRVAMMLSRPLLVSTQKGSETQIYLARSPRVAQVSGKYFVASQAVESSPASYDEVAQRRLWEASMAMTGHG